MVPPLKISECIYCFLQKVDRETHLLWEDAAPTERLPKCNEFVKFLETRCQRVENIERNNVALRIMPQVVKPRKAIHNSRNSFVVTTPVACCPVCNGVDHIIFDCPQFRKLTPQDRLQEAKKKLLMLIPTDCK